MEREFDLRSVQKGNFCQHRIFSPVDPDQTDGIEGERLLPAAPSVMSVVIRPVRIIDR